MKGQKKKNYYEVLGVNQFSPPFVIREAYHDLARIYHPDSNHYDEIISDAATDSRLFQEITEAYNVLSDQDGRRQYDLDLASALRGWEEDAAATLWSDASDEVLKDQEADRRSRRSHIFGAPELRSSRKALLRAPRSMIDIIRRQKERAPRLSLAAGLAVPFLLFLTLGVIALII